MQAQETLPHHLLISNLVQQYELGKRQPRIEQLQAIAIALDISPFYLMGDKTALMSRSDIAASMGLEDYLKSLGYEFIDDYEYEDELYGLCIGRKRKKLYLFSPQQLDVLGTVHIRINVIK